MDNDKTESTFIGTKIPCGHRWVYANVRFDMSCVSDDECPYSTAQNRLHELFSSVKDRDIDFEWIESIAEFSE